MATLQFLGAAGTVTGSKYVLESNGFRLLIDAGLYQGKKELRLRNWQSLPVEPSSIDAAVLTHAHIDHTGYLPVLVRDGYRGRVLATQATRDLATLMLPDSGRLQEEEAETANRLGYSKHSPARPLYTERDAQACLPRIDGIAYHQRLAVGPGIAVTFRPAGHILGSATVEADLEESGAPPRRIIFSGDLGRYGAPVIPDPEPVQRADALLLECTYGDREHGPVDPREALAAALNEAHTRGGAILIPSFAVGRAQEILYHLRQLEADNRIPVVPVFVDSPMAADATPIYRRHVEEHDSEMRDLLLRGVSPFKTQRLTFTRTVEESKRINAERRCIIISASGMATGGRVLHHLKNRLPDPKNTVLFAGYQSEGTRGRALLDGAGSIKIHGEQVTVRAAIRSIGAFSAHADHLEIDRWLAGFQSSPGRVFCVHGEAPGLEATRKRLQARGWNAHVPQYLERVEL